MSLLQESTARLKGDGGRFRTLAVRVSFSASVTTVASRLVEQVCSIVLIHDPQMLEKLAPILQQRLAGGVAFQFYAHLLTSKSSGAKEKVDHISTVSYFCTLSYVHCTFAAHFFFWLFPI